MTMMVSLQGLWAVCVGKEMNEAFGKMFSLIQMAFDNL